MKKIGIVLIGVMIICNVGVLWSEPTVKEILQKTIDRGDLIETMETDIKNDWYMPENNLISSQRGYLRIKKELTRLEILDADSKVSNIVVTNNSGTFVSTQGHEYILDDRVKTPPEGDQVSEESLIGSDLEKFSEYFTVSLIDQTQDVYEIKIVPTSKSYLFNKIYIEKTIDYANGVELETITNDKDGNFITSTSYTNFEVINGIYTPKTKTVKTLDPNAGLIINICTFDNIKYNQAMDDSLFYIDFEGTD